MKLSQLSDFQKGFWGAIVFWSVLFLVFWIVL